MNPTEIIGKNIKTIREQRGVKQEVLAKHINVTKSRMSQIESGDCEELTINRINKLAVFLEADFFEIAGNNPQNININNSTNCSSFNDTHYNVSTDLIKALADELVKRMNK